MFGEVGLFRVYMTKRVGCYRFILFVSRNNKNTQISLQPRRSNDGVPGGDGTAALRPWVKRWRAAFPHHAAADQGARSAHTACHQQSSQEVWQNVAFLVSHRCHTIEYYITDGFMSHKRYLALSELLCCYFDRDIIAIV